MNSPKWLVPHFIFILSFTSQAGAKSNRIKDDSIESKGTTTLDPISEILANVEILDVNAYIPEGYNFDQDGDDKLEHRNVENLKSQTVLNEEGKGSVPKVKPGKLNGKKLAAMAKQLETAKNDEKKEVRTGKKITGTSLEFSAETIFASILNGEEVKLKSAETSSESFLASKVTTTPSTSVPSSTSTTPTTTSTTPTTTTLPPKSTTPGVCGKFCSLAGTIFVKSGLDWSEELLYAYSDVYEEVTEQVVNEITKVFEKVYFGNAFEFASVEAFSREGETVLIDFYIQFGGIVFNVDTKDIKDSFGEVLEVDDSNKFMFGKFEIDLNSTYFIVVDTSSPLERIGAGQNQDASLLPEWAWLVVVVGVVSTFIIAFFGAIMGVQRYKHNQVLKTKVLNPKTLKQFRGQKHFDEVDVDTVTAYATDKRDMWTIQKTQQRAELAKSLNRKFSSKDSGRGSGKSGSVRGFCERFPSLGKGAGKRKFNPNDSNAELLGGNDSTCLDDSRDIIESGSVDPGMKTGADLFVQQPSRSILVPSLTAQGVGAYDSDCSSVSEGPSEMI